jgi:WD40 repeat protein
VPEQNLSVHQWLGAGLKKGLDFAFFESLMGFSGGDDAYIRAALQERRHLLLEALTTFHTFDVDGRGAIDVAKISFAMRAIGHSVDMYTVAKMVALADERHTGDIDFESFCLYVLGHSEEDLMEMLQAHRVQPLILDQQIGTQRRRLTVDRLAPAAWKKSFHLSRHIEEGAEKALEAKEKAEFVYQDYGQFGKLAFKHSLFDASMPILQLRLEKKILSRPWAITCAKDAGTVTSARFAPNGQRLAVSCHDGTLRIYDICSPKAKLIATVEANDHFCLCLEWTQDGSMIVTGGGDWMVSIWSAEDLSFLGSEMAHSGYVRAVATSFNNKYVASGSSDMSLRVWKYFPFKSDERPLLGHTSWVRWCHFSHDSKRLISGGDDQTIIVWDVMAGQALQTLRAHSHTVSAGYLFPNNRLFTGSFDENVLMWTLDTGLIGYLKVFVVEAFDLPAGDFLSGAMSNMRFVKIELGKGQQEQTDNKKGSSPGWFEEFNFSVWNLDESVCVQIFDWDKDEAHRFLGEAWVPLEELVYAEEGVTDREFELVDAEGGKGKACISLRFTFREVKCIGEVTVLVEKARNLPRMDTFGLADPFCAVNVGKSERHKTKVVKNNLNPEWNEEFVYNVEEGARELKLVLYDWSITKAEEFIGQVVFPIDELLKEPFRDQWFKLKTIDGAADAKGELKVKIKFLSEQERDKGAIRYRRNPTTWPASIREDFSYYAPVGQVKFFGRTIMRGICKHCKKHRNRHSNNLRCDLGVGNYVHCIDVSCDGQLIAWGTGDGRIRIASVLSSEQLACWTAHAGPVHGLKFAPEDERLISWGVDFREADPSEFFFGSFIPRPEAHSTHSIGRAQVVEIWYVGSMLASIQIGRQRRGLLSNAPNMGAADKDESDEVFPPAPAQARTQHARACP